MRVSLPSLRTKERCRRKHRAKALERSGDLAGAARAYETATSYLETARQEYAEAQSRRAAVAPTTGAHERSLYELSFGNELGAESSSKRDCYPSNARDV